MKKWEDFESEMTGYLQQMLKEYDVDAATSGNLVTNFNYIDEIIVWVIFTEDITNGNIRSSIRSRGPIINEVASHFNGGGHIYASGAKLKSFDEADLFIKELDEVCKNYKEQ